MAYIILSIVMLFVLGGLGALALAVYRVVCDKFEELMPERMVDFAGFVEIPHSK